MADTRIARRAHEGKHSDTFSNYRNWRAFLGAVEAPAACSSVAKALAAGHDWLTGRGWMADLGSGTRSWLLAESGLVSRKTLGV
jgi:hypothetical protein